MRKHIVVVVLLMACVTGAALAQQQQERPRRGEAPNGQNLEIPRLIEREEPVHYGAPFWWISADAFVDPSGFSIDFELLQELQGKQFAEKIVANHEAAMKAFNEGTEPPGYVTLTGDAPSNVMRPEDEISSLQQLIDTSEFVAVGVVQEAVGGFSAGTPGMMLRIRVEEWSGTEGSPPREEVLLFWPGGSFQIGFATLLTGIASTPNPPLVGDRAVLFPQKGRWSEGSASPFFSYSGGRRGMVPAMYFSQDGGRAPMNRLTRAKLPALSGAASFEQFSSALQVAVSRSPLR